MYDDDYGRSRVWPIAAAIVLILLAFCAAMFFGGYVHAAEVSAPPTSVVATVPSDSTTVPWGAWVSTILTWLATATIPIIAGWVAKHFADKQTGDRINNLLEQAVNYGLGAVAGATKGRTLDVQITNDILRVAANYAIANAPGLTEKIGDLLRVKLLARLSAKADLSPDVSASNVGATLPLIK